jgi:hypothetical protein
MLPIGDFGGCGPSPGVLKQKSQTDCTTAKLLGKILKEFGAFRATGFGSENGHKEHPKNILFFNLFYKK